MQWQRCPTPHEADAALRRLYLGAISFCGARCSERHAACGRGAFVEVPSFLSKYDPDALQEPPFKRLDENMIDEE